MLKVCTFLFLLQLFVCWSTEQKQRKMCPCRNAYGMLCMHHTIGEAVPIQWMVPTGKGQLKWTDHTSQLLMAGQTHPKEKNVPPLSETPTPPPCSGRQLWKALSACNGLWRTYAIRSVACGGPAGRSGCRNAVSFHVKRFRVTNFPTSPRG